MANLEQLAAELAQMHAWFFQSLSDQPDAADLFEEVVSQYESSILVNEIPKLQALLAVKLRHQRLSMPPLMTFTGESKNDYAFTVLPLDGKLPDSAGVYVLTSITSNQEGQVLHHPLMVGSCDDLLRTPEWNCSHSKAVFYKFLCLVRVGLNF